MVDVSRLNLFKSSPSPLASWIPSSISAPFTKDQIGQIEQYCKLCVIQPSIPLPVLPPDLVPWPSLDLPSARMIGSAKLHDGLYFLEHSPSSSRQYLVSSVESSPISHFQEIVLQHFRLGHPSFSYLAHLFLYYFKIIKISVYFIVNSVNLLSIFVSPFHLIHTHLPIFTNS